MYGIHPQEKIECEKCGSHVMFRGFKSHQRTIKCQTIFNNNKNNIREKTFNNMYIITNSSTHNLSPVICTQETQ